jgi:ornithine cyclodeaminase/alanine dehydrogenase-like protein (mu-crystallin family)
LSLSFFFSFALSTKMHHTLVQKMLILSESNVRQALQMKDCLAASRQALISIANGTCVVPRRLGIPFHNSEQPPNILAQDWTLFKPAATTDTNPVLMGCKIVSIRSQNPSRPHNKPPLPLVPASIVNVDATTGVVNAVLAGTYLTAARTAAGSALATLLCWRGRGRKQLLHLVVFGAGLQAELHVKAIVAAFQTSLPLVTIVNRTLERAEALKELLLQARSEDNDGLALVDHVHTVQLDDSLGVALALQTASCVVTATNTTVPLFDGALLPSGCHINGIGSYTADMQEISARTVDRCRVWIDTPEAREVGDLKHLSIHHPVQLLGDLLLTPDVDKSVDTLGGVLDCTFYKAVGTAIQDVMTADVVVKRARELGIGVEIDMS